MTMNRGGCGSRCGMRARFADDSEPAIFPQTKDHGFLSAIIAVLFSESRGSVKLAGTIAPEPGPGKVLEEIVTNGPVTPVLRYSTVDSGCSVPGTHPRPATSEVHLGTIRARLVLLYRAAG